MLDRLPPELVDLVLDLLPSPATLTGARVRQETLWACCLVCKKARASPEPFLWRHIVVLSNSQANRLIERCDLDDQRTERLKSGARNMRIEEASGNIEVGAIYALSAELENVVGIRIACADELDVTSFAHNHLRTLSFESNAICRPTATPDLPNLSSLSLYYVLMSADFISSILDSASRRSMRAVSLGASPFAFLRGNPFPPADQLDQLDMLQLYITDAEAFMSNHFRAATPVVVNVNDNELLNYWLVEAAEEHTPRHYRYYIPSDATLTPTSLCHRSLRRILSLVDVDPPPVSLHLPSILRSTYTADGTPPISLDPPRGVREEEG
ncbi:hypothetical protein JCM8547_000362 [Rhodosporidiobolus lusitaniae]